MDIDLNNNNLEMINTNEFASKTSILNAVEDSTKHTLESLNLPSFLDILDYLDSDALMELCRVNNEFRKKILMYKHILSRKLFEIPEFVDLQPILTEFGQSICKLDVNEYNFLHGKFSSKFNRLLENIVSYLVPGNLTELTLRFGVIRIDKDLLDNALPFFSNLKYFAFSACGSDDFSKAQEHVVAEIIGNAPKLTSLDVRYIRTAGKWFQFKHLKNLQRLTFLFVELTAYVNFRQFIQSRPALTSMVISTESVHHQHLCKLVSRYLPSLKEFEIRNSYLQLPHGDDFDFSPLPKDFKEINGTIRENVNNEEENDDDDDDNDQESIPLFHIDDTEDAETSFEESDSEMEFDSEDSDSDIDDVRDPEFDANTDHVTRWKSIYSCLHEMNYLKRIWLKSHFTNCADLYDTLKMLAKKNTLEHLTIQVSTLVHDFVQKDDFLAEKFPQGFTALKTIRLISLSNETQSFVRHFVRSLPNVTRCVLDAEKIDRCVQDTIANLVAVAENLETLVLKMPAMNFDHLLYMKLMGIQYCKSKGMAKVKPLVIYINSIPQQTKCLNELKDRYDEAIIAVRIKSFMTWETDPI